MLFDRQQRQPRWKALLVGARSALRLGSRLAGYRVVTNLLPDGRQIIGAFNTTPVSGAGGEVFRLTLHVKSDATLGGTTLHLTQDQRRSTKGVRRNLMKAVWY